jgi:hypothetical protein
MLLCNLLNIYLIWRKFILRKYVHERLVFSISIDVLSIVVINTKDILGKTRLYELSRR